MDFHQSLGGSDQKPRESPSIWQILVESHRMMIDSPLPSTSCSIRWGASSFEVSLMNAKLWLRSLLLFALFSGALRADSFGSGANSFTIDFVTIGAPGNPGDPTGNPNLAGAVPYQYRMGKYEISEQMIDKANAAGGLGITKPTIGPNQPATGVSWIEAARFVNWLNTSTGSLPAYKFGATGDPQYWATTDPGYNAGNLIRNSLARYFIPSVNEWYKAAYFDPRLGVYYNYPTGSDALPDGIDFLGDPNFDAVFIDNVSHLQPNIITNVGIASSFGVFGLGGNVMEWNETDFSVGGTPSLTLKGYRGGHWNEFSSQIRANTLGLTRPPTSELTALGFRVARVIPEPTGLTLAITFAILFYQLCLRLSPLTIKLAPLGFCLLVSASTLQADTFGSGANAFSIDLVTIGSPDNPADTTGVPNPAGSVPYSYRIGKYEVPEDAVRKANALGGLSITLDARGPNKPATSISWLEIAQFTNWLNTSTGARPLTSSTLRELSNYGCQATRVTMRPTRCAIDRHSILFLA